MDNPTNKTIWWNVTQGIQKRFISGSQAYGEQMFNANSLMVRGLFNFLNRKRFSVF